MIQALRRTMKRAPAALRWLLFTLGAACTGAAVAAAVLWLNFGSRAEVFAWAEKYPARFVLTALLYALCVCALGALFGRLWPGALGVSSAGLILALIDVFKTDINGTPLTLADFSLAPHLRIVADLAGSLMPPPAFFIALGILLIGTAALWLFSPLTELGPRVRFLSFSGALAALVFLFSASGALWAGKTFGVDVHNRMSAAGSHQFHGLTIALWRDAVLQDTEPPEDYSRERMEAVLARIDALTAEEDDPAPAEKPRPNVIFVLSESFFDVTALPHLTFDADPLENFHALEAEGISGRLHTHYLGYGTGYLEMAQHLGVSDLDFAADTNLCFLEDEQYTKLDALPKQYTLRGGYTAEMLHGFDDSLYNRTVTYPLMGYSNLYFSADIQQLGFDWSGGVYGGYYLKDRYLFHGMLDRMKAINDAGQRAFLYGITMENHQPYDVEKFGGACRIGVGSDLLSEEELDVVRVMVEGVDRADQALGELTALLRESDEPTIVVFYGDHRPNLFLPDGDTVYTKVGLCPDNDVSLWSMEEIGELYATDYLIWANDPALLDGLAGTREESSISALATKLLSLTGQPVSRWWHLLERVHEFALVDTALCFVDGDGRTWPDEEAAPLSAEERELLELRQAVVYDAFFGAQYITAAMNEPRP